MFTERWDVLYLRRSFSESLTEAWALYKMDQTDKLKHMEKAALETPLKVTKPLAKANPVNKALGPAEDAAGSSPIPVGKGSKRKRAEEEEATHEDDENPDDPEGEKEAKGQGKGGKRTCSLLRHRDRDSALGSALRILAAQSASAACRGEGCAAGEACAFCTFLPRAAAAP